MSDDKPGIMDWITSPLSSIFKMFTGGGSSTPETKPGTPAPAGNSGLFGGIEHMAENNPNLTAIGLAIADHEVNGTGLLGSIFTYWAASNVLEGKATGLFGMIEKLWLANEFKDAVEVGGQKMGLGNGLLDTIAGWAGGFFAFEHMGSMEDDINNRKRAPAPT